MLPDSSRWEDTTAGVGTHTLDPRPRDSLRAAFLDFVTIYVHLCSHPIRFFTAPPRDVLVPVVEVDHTARYLDALARSRSNTTLRDEFEKFTQLTTAEQRASVRAVSRSSEYANKVSGA